MGLQGDSQNGVGTTGALGGTSGKAFWIGLGATALVVAAFNMINTWTILHDRPSLNPYEPVIWEGSSWITLVLSCPIAWVALRVAPLRWPPRPRAAPVHILGFLAFTGAHVGGFILMRELIYWLAGSHYRYGASLGAAFVYEGVKDAFGYVLVAAAFVGAQALIARRAFASDTGTSPAAPFDIRDGSSFVRVKMADIVAVSSAGNYVEFALSDGRRPMARRSLSSLENELGARGFVRTHRSWLVNKQHVTGLKADGSGDYTVELGALKAPLSRRFPKALEELRSGV